MHFFGCFPGQSECYNRYRQIGILIFQERGGNMKRSFKTKWEDHVKRLTARVLVAALTVTACMQTMVFPAHAESYGKNGIVRDNMTSWQIVDDMGLGYNIGNTFDSIGSWITIKDPWEYQRAWDNDPVSKHFIQKVHQAGFKTIRLPVSWAHWIDSNNQIDPGYMAAIQTVVDWCMEEDMYVILNSHHDSGAADTSWVRNVATDFDGTSKKYAAMWTQIASNFANYGDHLIFEGMNEVEFPAAPNMSRQYELLNHMNQLFVDTVRATGGNNAKRHLLIPGYNTDIRKTSDRRYQMPNDPAGHCILSIHYYSPSPFAVAEYNVDWCEPVTTWGSEEDIATVREDFDILANNFLGKGIPIIIGEYGVLTEDKKEKESLRAYVKTIPEIAMEYGMCPVLWDSGNSGDMKYIERISGEFRDPQIRANYAELARRKANGQIAKKDLTIPAYKEVELPISPGGWVSLESFEPSRVLGIKFRLSCSSDWDSYGGGGIWIDGYSNTPQYQFNSVFDEVTYMFTEEERARIGDRLGILLWWTDESKGGNKVKDLSFENGRVTLLYAEDENVSQAGPYTNTGVSTRSSGGGGGGGGGGGSSSGSSSRPNNSTTPGGNGNQYGEKDVKDYPYQIVGTNAGNNQVPCKIDIREICPDCEIGDKVRLTMYPLTDDWASGVINVAGTSLDPQFDNKTKEWTFTLDSTELDFIMWSKGGTYYRFALKCEIVEKARKIDPIILNKNNTAEEPQEKNLSLSEMKQMLDMPELKEGERYQVTVGAESEDGNPYKCEVTMMDKNGAEVKFELEGKPDDTRARSVASYPTSGSLIGTPKADSVIKIKVTEGRVCIKRIAVKILEEYKGISEMRQIGQVIIRSGQIEKKIVGANQAEGLKIYYHADASMKGDIDGHLLVNAREGWDDKLTADKWTFSEDAGGKYIYIPADSYSGVDINLAFLRLWTVNKAFKIEKIVQEKREKKEFSAIEVSVSNPLSYSLADLLRENGISDGDWIKITVSTQVDDGGYYGSDISLTDQNGVKIKGYGTVADGPGNTVTTLVGKVDKNSEINVAVKTGQDDSGKSYTVTQAKIVNIEIEPYREITDTNSLAVLAESGGIEFTSEVVSDAKRVAQAGEDIGVRIYFESNYDLAGNGGISYSFDPWFTSIANTNIKEDGTGKYIFIALENINSFSLNLWGGTPVTVKKLEVIERYCAYESEIAATITDPGNANQKVAIVPIPSGIKPVKLGWETGSRDGVNLYQYNSGNWEKTFFGGSEWIDFSGTVAGPVEGSCFSDTVWNAIKDALDNNQQVALGFYYVEAWSQSPPGTVTFYYDQDPGITAALSLDAMPVYNTVEAVQKSPGMFYMPISNVPVGIRYTTSEAENEENVGEGQAVLRMTVPYEEEDSKDKTGNTNVNNTNAGKAPAFKASAKPPSEESLSMATPSDAELTAAFFDTAQAMTESSNETVTHAFSALIAIFVTSALPIQQFFSLASASHGIFSINHQLSAPSYT